MSLDSATTSGSINGDIEEHKLRFYTTRPPRPPRIDRKKHLSMEIQHQQFGEEETSPPIQRDELNVHFLAKTQQVVKDRILNAKNPSIIDLSECNLSQIPKIIIADTAFSTTLKELNLSHNKLTSLPSSINLLLHLAILDCAFNRLTDLPAELADLPQLQHLHVAGNPLHAELKQKTLLGTPAVLLYLKGQQKVQLSKSSSGTIRKRDRLKLFMNHSSGSVSPPSLVSQQDENNSQLSKTPPHSKTPTHAPLLVPPSQQPSPPSSPGPNQQEDDFANPLIIQMKLGLEASIGLSTTNRDANNKFRTQLSDGRGTFKFYSYCNSQFAELRSMAGVDTETYRASLQSVAALGFSGKSGSVLLRSADNLLVLKTISREESSFLRRILSTYCEHMKHNPNSALARFWGLYKVSKGPLVRVSFVVMKNAFSSGLKIHERYDLKGSRVGRHSIGEENLRLSRVMLKDLDLCRMNRRIKLGPSRQAFIDQITSDSKFLEKFEIIDYSLILGIHYFEDWPTTTESGTDEAQREAAQKFMKSHPERLFGEVMGKTDTNDFVGEMYFMTIIDFLQPYNLRKQLEHGVKSIRYGDDISVIPPSQYSQRFVAFITAVVD